MIVIKDINVSVWYIADAYKRGNNTAFEANRQNISDIFGNVLSEQFFKELENYRSLTERPGYYQLIQEGKKYAYPGFWNQAGILYLRKNGIEGKVR